MFKTENHAYFPGVNISDISYDVMIMAFSLGGITVNPTVYFNLKEVNSNFFGNLELNPLMSFFNSLNGAFIWHLIVSVSVHYKRTLIVIGILSPFLVLLSVSFIFVVIQNHRNRMKHKKEIFSKEMYLRKLIQSHNKDEMEIEPANVELYELLGEGAFGIVRKGLLKPTNKPIAVKMLRGPQRM